ncbi:hypothetical protein [Cytobacillus praedii]|uniref:Uncharacterized protein n=1 Tax=Cytobacillus praedii TaxID=1742358 RepID=A0A4R1AMW2_9BACI|nr:hypothetical protein [Cytobacillus praedii]TCJ01082.1 hypothetical protein E0Y62_25790 [Cytobacillus praedii]
MKSFSNYHGINTNEKLTHDGLLILQKSLDGYAGYDVIINNSINSKVLIYQKWDANSETKRIIGRIEDIERGNLIHLEGVDWLITTHPEDNKIYRKAEIRLCNSTFPIESDKTPVLMRDENGNVIYDDYGMPVFEDVQSETIHEPCIVETKYYFNNRNEQITLPEDRVLITMKYKESKSVDVNHRFDLYKSKFKITFVDYSKVVNGTGIMVVTGERVVND